MKVLQRVVLIALVFCGVSFDAFSKTEERQAGVKASEVEREMRMMEGSIKLRDQAKPRISSPEVAVTESEASFQTAILNGFEILRDEIVRIKGIPSVKTGRYPALHFTYRAKVRNILQELENDYKEEIEGHGVRDLLADVEALINRGRYDEALKQLKLLRDVARKPYRKQLEEPAPATVSEDSFQAAILDGFDILKDRIEQVRDDAGKLTNLSDYDKERQLRRLRGAYHSAGRRVFLNLKSTFEKEMEEYGVTDLLAVVEELVFDGKYNDALELLERLKTIKDKPYKRQEDPERALQEAREKAEREEREAEKAKERVKVLREVAEKARQKKVEEERQQAEEARREAERQEQEAREARERAEKEEQEAERAQREQIEREKEDATRASEQAAQESREAVEAQKDAEQESAEARVAREKILRKKAVPARRVGGRRVRPKSAKKRKLAKKKKGKKKREEEMDVEALHRAVQEVQAEDEELVGPEPGEEVELTPEQERVAQKLKEQMEARRRGEKTTTEEVSEAERLSRAVQAWKTEDEAEEGEELVGPEPGEEVELTPEQERVAQKLKEQMEARRRGEKTTTEEETQESGGLLEQIRKAKGKLRRVEEGAEAPVEAKEMIDPAAGG